MALWTRAKTEGYVLIDLPTPFVHYPSGIITIEFPVANMPEYQQSVVGYAWPPGVRQECMRGVTPFAGVIMVVSGELNIN
jgi:hypothetical protein